MVLVLTRDRRVGGGLINGSTLSAGLNDNNHNHWKHNKYNNVAFKYPLTHFDSIPMQFNAVLYGSMNNIFR